MMIEVLKNEPASVPCVFPTRWVGGTTGGMVGRAHQGIQIPSELRKMEDIDLVSPKSTMDDPHPPEV